MSIQPRVTIRLRDSERVFAERPGLFVQRFYKDEGERGGAGNRKALLRLLRDCRAGRIGAVIISSPDRLARNVRLVENLFHEFEQLGVHILIADMPTYNGKDRKDVLIRQIREAIAEENRKDIIERLWKGRQERVRRGLPPGGNVPYGYRRNGKGLVIDEAEAEAVKAIFKLAARGFGSANIATSLNQRRFLRRNGHSWTRREVSAVLARRGFYERGLLSYGEVMGHAPELRLFGPTEGGDPNQ